MLTIYRIVNVDIVIRSVLLSIHVSQQHPIHQNASRGVIEIVRTVVLLRYSTFCSSVGVIKILGAFVSLRYPTF
jgi:hypothetical protein